MQADPITPDQLGLHRGFQVSQGTAIIVSKDTQKEMVLLSGEDPN